MTRTPCSVHGLSFTVVACSHLSNAVEQKTVLPDIIVARFDFGSIINDQGKEISLSPNLCYCSVCAKKHGYPLSSGEFEESEYETLGSEIKFVPVCVECWEIATVRKVKQVS